MEKALRAAMQESSLRASASPVGTERGHPLAWIISRLLQPRISCGAHKPLC